MTDGLLLCAKDAVTDLLDCPSPDRTDDVLYCICALARSLEAPADSLLAIAHEVCSPEVLASNVIPHLSEWLSAIGEPLLHAAEAHLGAMPLDAFLLSGVAESSPAQEQRALFNAAFQLRDLLQLAASIDVEERRHLWEPILSRADSLLRSRLLRALCLNDLRSTIAADMRPGLGRELWWWTRLSDLPMDALGQWLLGDLPAAQAAAVSELLTEDAALLSFLDDLRATTAGLHATSSDRPQFAAVRGLVFDLAQALRVSVRDFLASFLAFSEPQGALAFAAAGGPRTLTATLSGAHTGYVVLRLSSDGIGTLEGRFQPQNPVRVSLFDPSGRRFLHLGYVGEEASTVLRLLPYRAPADLHVVDSLGDDTDLRLLVAAEHKPSPSSPDDAPARRV